MATQLPLFDVRGSRPLDAPEKLRLAWRALVYAERRLKLGSAPSESYLAEAQRRYNDAARAVSLSAPRRLNARVRASRS